MKRLLPLACFFFLTCSLQTHAQSKPHFNHTTIFVTDLVRASKFYKEVMMLDIIPEPFHDMKHTWFSLGNHGQLHVVSGATEDIAHDISIHLAFSVASLPDFITHLEKFGVEYRNYGKEDKKLQMRPDNVTQIYLQDPDGFWIEVNNDPY